MQHAASDAGIVGQVIGLHYEHAPTILDTTSGGLRMWRGCAYQPTIRFDRRPLPGIDIVGEWSDMPALLPTRFQVATFDPPHQTHGGHNALGGGWADAYGTAAAARQDLQALSISGLYPGFLEAVRQVLDPVSGLLLAKIADQTHGGLQQLQAVDFVLACREAGWSVCEMIPKMRRPGPMDPKWRRQYHVRKAWSYWICAHPGPRCPAVGVSLVRDCEGCGRPFRAHRSHAKACGKACQDRLYRRRREGFSRSVAQVEKPS